MLHINTIFGNDPLTNKIWIYLTLFVVTSILSRVNKNDTQKLGEIFYFLENIVVFWKKNNCPVGAPQNLTKMSTAKRFGERTAEADYKVTRSRQGANPLCLQTPVHNEIIIFSATVT